MKCNYHETLNFWCVHINKCKHPFKEWVRANNPPTKRKHCGHTSYDMYNVPEADAYPEFVAYVNDRRNPSRGFYKEELINQGKRES